MISKFEIRQFPIPDEIDDYGLDSYSFRIYAHLANWTTQHDRDCNKSVYEIAVRCGMDIKTARNSLQSLAEKRIISITSIAGSASLIRLNPVSNWLPISTPIKQQTQKVKRPSGKSLALKKLQVFARDKYTCVYCGAKGVELHCDHVIPISKGGSNEMDNLTTSCQKCNLVKGKRSSQEFNSIMQGEQNDK